MGGTGGAEPPKPLTRSSSGRVMFLGYYQKVHLDFLIFVIILWTA